MTTELSKAVHLISCETGVSENQIMELLDKEARTSEYDLRTEVARGAIHNLSNEEYCYKVGEGLGSRPECIVFGAIIIACVDWDI